MERILFESLVSQDEQINRLESFLNGITNVKKFKVQRMTNGVILILEVVRISSFEIAKSLFDKGFKVERIYEE